MEVFRLRLAYAQIFWMILAQVEQVDEMVQVSQLEQLEQLK